jgi:hypothetical protein
MNMMSDVDYERVIELCQRLCEGLWKVEGVTFGEMLFALTVTISELLTLEGRPRAGEFFKTSMAKPLEGVTNQTRIDLCADAIIKFGETLNEKDRNDVPAICALAATKIAEVGFSEAHGDTIRNLWKATLKIYVAERLAEDFVKIMPTQSEAVN